MTISQIQKGLAAEINYHQTGTNLSQFDKSLVDLQAQLDTPPSFYDWRQIAMDPNSRLARGLDTAVNIGLGRQSFGDVAKDYATRKLDELPQFSQKYEFSPGEQNLSDYAEGLLFDALPTKAKAAVIHAPDIKSLVVEDVANVIGVPYAIKQGLLEGKDIGDSTKDYLVNKINESSLPFNLERRGDTYTLNRKFDLGSNASLRVSENLRSGRDPNTRVDFDASTNLGGGRLSATASKDSGRPARASLGYDWKDVEKIDNKLVENASFSASIDKVEGRKPEFNLKFNKKLNKR